MNLDYITLTWDLKPTKISKSGGDGDGGGPFHACLGA